MIAAIRHHTGNAEFLLSLRKFSFLVFTVLSSFLRVLGLAVAFGFVFSTSNASV
jgi:hypothetical protein